MSKESKSDDGDHPDKLKRLQRLREVKRKVVKDNRAEIRNESIGRKVLNVTPQESKKLNKKEKLLQYTIEETDNWVQQQPEIKASGFSNFNDLAATVYRKEINNSKVDKEAYKRGGLNKPSDEQLEALAETLKTKKNKKRDLDTGVYINQKNKDFNAKLERQS